MATDQKNTVPDNMYDTLAYGKPRKDMVFQKLIVRRAKPGPEDVKFDVHYCGICHTDVHYANGEVPGALFPLVPGHELAGIVTEVGNKVTKFKVGDRVGVGCIVESCLNCKSCVRGEEQYCVNGFTMTYSSQIKYGLINTESQVTQGGYSKATTVHEHFVIKIPDNYPLEAAGPIFCAGITMYSPLVHWKAKKGGLNVGVVGIGGLGQMGIRLAKAMGNHVTAISSSIAKREPSMEAGASAFVLTTDNGAMKEAAGKLDLILNTISAPHEVMNYLPLLSLNGTMVQLGIVAEPVSVQQGILIMGRKSLAGSVIGGIQETQDCIDFCAASNIVPTTEIITNKLLESVYAKLTGKNDTIKRYVLDVKNSENE